MPPVHRITRRPPRAIPVAEPGPSRSGKAAIPRAIPVEPGWTPKARDAARAAGTEKRRGLFSNVFKPATRTAAPARASAQGPVKQYGKYQSLSQLDYAKERLGNGNKTIASHGCFLTSMAMASTGLTGRATDPASANRLVRAGKGFAGGALEAPLAARALGMKLVDRRAMNDGNAASMRVKLDGWLASGKPAVAGVDFHEGRSTGTRGSNADHFITIVDKNKDGSYVALDPLGGRKINLHLDGAGRLVTRGVVAGTRPYQVDELAFLDKR